MVMRVGSASITSDETGHVAQSVGEGMWVLSWQPGRTFDHNQAACGMLIATQIAATLEGIQPWSEQIGLTAKEAMGLVLRTPWPQ